MAGGKAGRRCGPHDWAHVDRSRLHPIVARLRERRLHELRLTIRETAELLGWTDARLNSYELGRTQPNVGDAVDWARALGMDLGLGADVAEEE